MKRIAIFLMSVFALASCAKDDLSSISTATTGTTTVTFSADGFDEVSTRAVNETSINDVTILQFVGGTLKKKIEKTGISFGSAVEIEDLVSMPATTMETVIINGTEIEQIVENGSENVIVFLANTTVSSSSLTLTTTDDSGTATSFSDFQSMTMGSLDLSTYLPMVGYYYDGIVAGATNQMVVSLKRSVAKISFTLNTTNFYEDNGEGVTEQPSIDVKSITLKNVPNVITPYACLNRPALPVSPNNGVWPETQVPFPTYDSGTFGDYTTADNQSTTPTASGTFYMPENCRGSYDGITSNAMKIPDNVTGEEDENSLTYIEVVLEYTMNTTGVIKEATYQIYLGGNATGDMNLLRNTNYSVTTYLYGADESDTRITVESIWDPTDVDFGTYDDQIEAVANCYMIDPTDIPSEFYISLLQARSGWSMIDSYTGNTAGENLAEFDALIQSGDWEIVTLWRTWGASQGGDAYNIIGSKLDLSSNNSDNAVANYYASLTFGSEINNATNGLNSLGGNAVIALKSTANNGDTGTDINGNAVGTIYWSWHLWFTDYDPNGTTSASTLSNILSVDNGRIEQYGAEYLKLNSGKYMMDRNLGATVTGLSSDWASFTSYESGYDGMFYQFGRKDPFVGSNRSSYNTITQITIYGADGNEATIDVTDCSTPTVSTEGNLIKAVNNPLHFITVSTGDWAILGNIDYWSYAGAKSPFDPCPAGWRLPASGTWADFSYDSSATFSFTTLVGGVYDSRVFYPASGHRLGTSGAMTGVGSYGYYWSATPGSSSANGYSLYFSISSVGPAGSSSRSNGRLVRPIQE